MPQNRLATPVILFFNLAVVIALTLYLRNQIKLPCVQPAEASAASAGIILLMFFHLFWRHFTPLMPANPDGGADGNVALGILRVSLKTIQAILDELHPWKLSTRRLWVLAALLLLSIGFANLSTLSPFRVSGEKPIVQGFFVQRLDGTTETLNPGDVLSILANERLQIEARIHAVSEASCTWSIAGSDASVVKGCSIVFGLPSGRQRDSLTVIVQSPCSTYQTNAGLHVVEQQAAP